MKRPICAAAAVLFLSFMLSSSAFASGGWVNGRWVDPTCLYPECFALPPLYPAEIYFASPLRGFDEVQSFMRRGGAIAMVATNDDDAPYIIITKETILVHPMFEHEILDLADAYMREVSRNRPFLLMRYPDHLSAQRQSDLLASTTYGFLRQTWIADGADGSAFLVYRNPG